MTLRGFIALFCFGLAALLSACTDPEEPAPTEDEVRFAEVWADLTLLSESARLGLLADTTRAYRVQADSVLEHYEFTREEFEEEFRRLSSDPARSRILFETASKRIQTLRARRDSSAATP